MTAAIAFSMAIQTKNTRPDKTYLSYNTKECRNIIIINDSLWRVPIFDTAYTFRTPQDNQVSYGWCLLIQDSDLFTVGKLPYQFC